MDASPILVDGYTASQWAAYAKKKASIATQACRQNGRLKALLADRLRVIEDAPSACSQGKDDIVHRADPWANAKPLVSARSPQHQHDGCIHVWANWRPSGGKSDAGVYDDGLPVETCIDKATIRQASDQVSTLTAECHVKSASDCFDKPDGAIAESADDIVEVVATSDNAAGCSRSQGDDSSEDDLSRFHPDGRRAFDAWVGKFIETDVKPNVTYRTMTGLRTVVSRNKVFKLLRVEAYGLAWVTPPGEDTEYSMDSGLICRLFCGT